MYSRTLLKGAVLVVAGLAFAGPATASLKLTIPRLNLAVPLNYVSQDPSPIIYYQDKDTLAIAGHRVTHTRPFYYIDTIRLGDFLYIDYGKYRNKYKVIHLYPAVRPTDVRQYLKMSGVILSACTPRHFATYRYVVRARLVKSYRR